MRATAVVDSEVIGERHTDNAIRQDAFSRFFSSCKRQNCFLRSAVGWWPRHMGDSLFTNQFSTLDRAGQGVPNCIGMRKSMAYIGTGWDRVGQLFTYKFTHAVGGSEMLH